MIAPWDEFEEVASTYDQVFSFIDRVSNLSKDDRVFAWRGQGCSTWPLTSKLFRSLMDTTKASVREKQLAKAEKKILIEFRRWGLHNAERQGRLSVLSQLALLQHFEAPTRLIDITFNPLVAVFFAVENATEHSNLDARIFAFDITGRLINERKYLRQWEDSQDTPWSDSYAKNLYKEHWRQGHEPYEANKIKFNVDELNESDFVKEYMRDWCSNFFAWKAPRLDQRIAAQNAGFILGGGVESLWRQGYIDPELPIKKSSFQARRPKPRNSSAVNLSISELRSLTCIALRPNKIPEKIRSNSAGTVYTLRIKSDLKIKIRDLLSRTYGYSHASIYPDIPGFAKNLKTLDLRSLG